MLRTFQDRCEEAVRQFGGTVVQCTDKGLLACYGFPVAYEDAAGRAARSGRAILDAMKRSEEPSDRRHTLNLDPWVGIHTGAAIVESRAGAVSLVGDARNVAVRLEDVAVAGQIICTEVSHRLFQGQFQCVSLGRQKIKSVTHPVELFRVEDAAVAGSPIDAVTPAELSPLTGRDLEMGLLRDRWERAREGMGQVVLLSGEPGLGKSRLVHTMKQHVLGQMIEGEVDAPVIEWRCSPHFQNTALYPAIDFYERALAFHREKPPPARFDRLLHRLEQYPWPGPRPCRCGRRCCRSRHQTVIRRCRCHRSGNAKKPFAPCWSGCTRGPPGSRSCSSSRTCIGRTPPRWSFWGSSSPRASTTPS